MPLLRPKMIIDEYGTKEPAAEPAVEKRGGLLGLFGGGGGDGPSLGLLGGEEGDFRDTLRRLGPALMMMDPMYANAGVAMAKMQGDRAETRAKRKSQNQTAAWLATQGVGENEAAYLASNPTAMNSWYTAWKAGQKPDWQFHEMTNADGRKQSAMVDMKTGDLKWLGSAAAPNVTIETIYENGNEQKVLFNHDTNEVVTKLGGAKSNLKTPEEMDQALEIAKAGAAPKGEEKYDQTRGEIQAKDYDTMQKDARKATSMLGTLRLMEDAVKSKGFVSGGGGDAFLKLKQLGKTFGWEPDALPDMEMFNTLSKKMIFDTLGSLGSGVSGQDLSFVTDIMPGLGTSRGGNLGIIEIQRKIQQRNVEIAKLARDYVKTTEDGRLDDGWEDVLAEYGAQHPLFSESDIKDIKAKVAMADEQDAGADAGAGAGGAGAAPLGDMVEVRPGVSVPRSLLPPDHPALQGQPAAPAAPDEMIEVRPGVKVPRSLLEQQGAKPMPVDPTTTPKGPRMPIRSRFGY